MPMLIAMLQILAMWLALWVVFYGWGVATLRACRCERGDAFALLVCPWVGVAAVTAALQLLHFAAPIRSVTFGVVSVIGGLAMIVYGLPALRLGMREIGRHWWLGGIGVVLVAWLANRSLNTQEYHDNGLYYLNAIRWATDYPIVPGIVNLHNRLAFNNSNFLLQAILEIDGWRGYSGHILNGFLAALCVPIMLRGLWSMGRSDSRRQSAAWFVVALGMLVAMGATDRRISSGNPDFAAVLLVTVAAWLAISIGTNTDERTGGLLRWNLVACALTAAAAITIKTSVIFFAASALLAILVWMLGEVRRGRVSLTTAISIVATMAVCSGTLIGPWMARGYVLSGCPLFPSTIGRAPVEWAVAPEDAASLRKVIYAYGRTTVRNRDAGFEEGWGWFKPWLIQIAILRAPMEIVAPATITLLCLLTLAGRRFLWPDYQLPETTILPPLLFAAYVVGIVAWFLTVPSPRMGAFAWWGLAGTALVMTSERLPSGLVPKFRKPLLAALVLLFLLPMTIEAALIETRYRTNPNLPEFGKHFYELQPFVLPTWDGGFPPVPKPELETKTTDSGLTVYFSVKDNSVWDSPLPAAVDFQPKLMLRTPGDMQGGFKFAE